MGSFERRQQFKELISKLDEPNIKLLNNQKSPKPMQLFFGTYLGQCFIEGYRIQQKIGQNLVLLSQMSFQNALDYSLAGVRKLHGNYRILCIEFKEDINSDKQLRTKIFDEIKCVIQMLKDEQGCLSCLEIHFIFVSTFKYAVVDEKFLDKGSALDVANFYERNYGLSHTRGYKMVNQRIEGIKLHYLVELFLKGYGVIRNNKILQEEVLHHSRFNYNPEKVLNTICFILGKEIIQGKYITITSEKWMRKSTIKKFKRFDLLLRNDDKVCIIDWKFSRVQAQYKMTDNKITDRNKVYFQLARKQFNSDVELKFYCFHQKSEGKYHHQFSVAEFQSSIESVDISDGEIISDSDSSIYMISQFNQNDSDRDKSEKREEKKVKQKYEVKVNQLQERISLKSLKKENDEVQIIEIKRPKKNGIKKIICIDD